jgi:hypothetical protein
MREYCDCSMNYILKNYSFGEVVDSSDEMNSGEMPPMIRKAFSQCIDKL